MAASPAKRRNAFRLITHILECVVRRVKDTDDLANRRLAAIEDRLAKIDGGPAAGAAAKEALLDLVADRVSAGRETPTITIVDGRPKWFRPVASEAGEARHG